MFQETVFLSPAATQKKAKEQKENEEGKQESLSKAQAAGTSNPAAIDEPSEQATDLDKASAPRVLPLSTESAPPPFVCLPSYAGSVH